MVSLSEWKINNTDLIGYFVESKTFIMITDVQTAIASCDDNSRDKIVLKFKQMAEERRH